MVAPGNDMGGAIKEHDVVALLRDLPEHGLQAGDAGTVVHVYADRATFEVEFPDPSGEEHFVIITTTADSLLRLRRVELLRLAS